MGKQTGHRRVTSDIERVDDEQCTILHVDMDAFFAAVELRRRPELRGRPMMVAGTGGRGVVLSATYEARAYGVRSAMPTAQALARCPGIVVVPPEHGAYRDASRQLMALMGSVTSLVEPLSVDEAFLDVAGARRRLGRPARIADQLRRRISDELGLTATVGAATSKFVAKLASSLAKPDGLLVVPSGEVTALLRPLSVRALWGVGGKTAERLQSLGLVTVGDIADADPAVLGRSIGRTQATRLHDLAHGRDDRVVTPERAEASIGAEETFSVDVSDPVALRRALLDLSRTTARRARRAGVAGRVVVLKVRYSDFSTVTRSRSISAVTQDDHEVYQHALHNWERLPAAELPIRLLGVRLEGLVRADAVSRQLELDIDIDVDVPRGAGTGSGQWSGVSESTTPRRQPGWSAAQSVVDRLADRFGSAAPRPAALLPPREEAPAPARRDATARPRHGAAQAPRGARASVPRDGAEHEADRRWQ